MSDSLKSSLQIRSIFANRRQAFSTETVANIGLICAITIHPGIQKAYHFVNRGTFDSFDF